MKRLRRSACFAALAVAGALAAVAAGPGLGAVSLPTVTLPTLPVSTPTVTLPTPPPPPVPPAPVPPAPPAPVPPPPVAVPGVTPPPPAAATPPPPSSPATLPPAPGSTPAARAGGSPAQSSAPTTGGAASRSAGSSGSTSSSAAVAAGPHARPRVHLSGAHPATTLVYRLQRGGVVRVVVLQVGCGRISAFPVRAHEGTNTLRVRRTIKGRRLPDGTYRIRGRAHGRTVLRATLVIGKGGRAPCSLAAVTNGLAAIFGPASGASSEASTSAATASAVGGSSGKLAAGKTAGAAAGVRPHPASGVLGAAASKVLPGGTGTQLGLLIVLAGAILLLAVGALPRNAVPHAAAAAFLARERVTIAAAGLAALGAVLIAYLIT